MKYHISVNTSILQECYLVIRPNGEYSYLPEKFDEFNLSEVFKLKHLKNNESGYIHMIYQHSDDFTSRRLVGSIEDLKREFEEYMDATLDELK